MESARDSETEGADFGGHGHSCRKRLSAPNSLSLLAPLSPEATVECVSVAIYGHPIARPKCGQAQAQRSLDIANQARRNSIRPNPVGDLGGILTNAASSKHINHIRI
eukprot:15458636-Alexandrium_andersonii.AAC.1